MLEEFNLGVPPEVQSALISLADFDGDGQINYAEFARIMTADDIGSMKNTLAATDHTAGGGVNAARFRREISQGKANRGTLTRRCAPRGGTTSGRPHSVALEQLRRRVGSWSGADSEASCELEPNARFEAKQRVADACGTSRHKT